MRVREFTSTSPYITACHVSETHIEHTVDTLSLRKSNYLLSYLCPFSTSSFQELKQTKELRMPIKEIVSFTLGIVMTIAVAGGPLQLRANLRKVQIEILREMTRTDNWGNPSPWAHSRAEIIKTKRK